MGGLIFGARRSRRSLVETFLLIAVLFPIVCLPLASVHSADDGRPDRHRGPAHRPAHLSPQRAGGPARIAASTESSTWLLTAVLAGVAAGSAAGGALAESEGWRAAILVGCAVAAAGAALAVTLRRTLAAHHIPSFSR